jgi:FKBP-type peptidyl-prolyl cis-trans isomerase
MKQIFLAIGIFLLIYILSVVAFNLPKKSSPGTATITPPGTTSSQSAKLKTNDEKVGTGTTAQTGDTVTVNYTGTLTNGKEFDSTKGKQPFTFTLGTGQVIKGWDEGIVGMKVGGKRKLTIPPDLGYGAQGAGAAIPPNSTLIFDVELLDVKSAPKPNL